MSLSLFSLSLCCSFSFAHSLHKCKKNFPSFQQPTHPHNTAHLPISSSTNINKLAAEIEAAKKSAETRELMEGAKKKKKKGEIEVTEGGGEVCLLCFGLSFYPRRQTQL